MPPRRVGECAAGQVYDVQFRGCGPRRAPALDQQLEGLEVGVADRNVQPSEAGAGLGVDGAPAIKTDQADGREDDSARRHSTEPVLVYTARSRGVDPIIQLTTAKKKRIRRSRSGGAGAVT